MVSSERFFTAEQHVEFFAIAFEKSGSTIPQERHAIISDLVSEGGQKEVSRAINRLGNRDTHAMMEWLFLQGSHTQQHPEPWSTADSMPGGNRFNTDEVYGLLTDGDHCI
jgi:uncharacterized UBP type Zn finger protein